MTLNELIEKAQVLKNMGLGEAHVIMADNCADYEPYTYSIHGAHEFFEETILGSRFDTKTKKFVYLCADKIVHNYD